MPARELVWRSTRALTERWPQRHANAGLLIGAQDWNSALASFRDRANRTVLLNASRARSIAEKSPALCAEVIEAADAVRELRFEFPGFPEVSLPRPLNWRYDPIANRQWPDLPSHKIDYRTDVASEVKWIWKLNRLQHLPWLAEAWLFTGDERYATAAFEQLDTWIDQNPTGRGIAWYGAFESALRAISVTVALQGLQDAPGLDSARFRRIVTVLAESADRCWKGRSLYSSANNHLIAEMAGLAVVAIAFPELRRAQIWERRALSALVAEAPKQILSDGSGAEQSISYQIFTVEFLNIVATLLRQRDGSAPAPVVNAVSRSSSFLSCLIGSNDPAPRYGDDDDGFALRLGAQPVRTLHDHLDIVSGTSLIDRDANAVSSLDAAWFAVPDSSTTPGGSDSPTKAGESFYAVEGGLVVMRRRDCRITMDVGPLGYLKTASHGHADALAVTIAKGGHEIVSDPGTGSFYGHPEWRSRMRGTAAHPTVCVDGLDQSISVGTFLWSNHPNVTVNKVDLDRGIVDAQHDGYMRLDSPVLHRRWLISPASECMVLVVDLLTGTGKHSFQQTWPLHPDLDVEKINGGYVLIRQQKSVIQLLHAASDRVAISSVRAEDVDNSGWWSDPLHGRQPAWWLTVCCHTTAPVAFATMFCPSDDTSTEGLSVRFVNGNIEVTWTEDGRLRSALVDPQVAGKVSVGTGADQD